MILFDFWVNPKEIWMVSPVFIIKQKYIFKIFINKEILRSPSFESEQEAMRERSNIINNLEISTLWGK